MNVEKSKKTESSPSDILFKSGQYLLLGGVREIRERLGLDEETFYRFGRLHNQRGRRHYVYAVLDEIEQVAIWMEESKSFFNSDPGPPEANEQGKRILRNILLAAERDLSLLTRRLIEILAELINFSRTNLDEYFDHYLLYRELDQHKKRQTDFKKYFECTNRNTEARIDLTKRSIATAELKLQLTDSWYLKGKSPKPGGAASLASFQEVFDAALQRATRSERTVLGFYYERAYRAPSRSIHLNIGGLGPPASFELLEARRGQINLIALHCLLRCRRLLNIRSRKGPSAEIARSLQMPVSADSIYRRTVHPSVHKGDFVLIFDSLCEVVRANTSRYGYKSFEVRYITKPLIHNEDCFPAIYVSKLIDGNSLRIQVEELLRSKGAAPPSAKRIRKAMRESALRLWRG